MITLAYPPGRVNEPPLDMPVTLPHMPPTPERFEPDAWYVITFARMNESLSSQMPLPMKGSNLNDGIDWIFNPRTRMQHIYRVNEDGTMTRI